MILKSYIVEQNLNTVTRYKAVLLYGENSGIKEDIKEEIKKKNKEEKIINFFQEDLVKNKNILNHEVNNSSLFQDKKIIFLHEITDKLFEEISDSLSDITDETKIFIFSNVLDKKSKMRSFFEKEKNLAIIACYQDNERSLSNYIRFKLKNINGLNQEIINLIINNSNMDRKIISEEILKIQTYFGTRKLERNTIKEILNIKTNIKFEQIRDATLVGNKHKVNTMIGEMDIVKEDIYLYLNQMSLRVSKLLEVSRLNENFKDLNVAIDQMKPKIFWKDKPVYIEQLQKINLNKLLQISKVIGETEVILKKNSKVRSDTLIKNLIINICSKVSSAS
jgi:DNA polymerase-3 subunit delta